MSARNRTAVTLTLLAALLALCASVLFAMEPALANTTPDGPVSGTTAAHWGYLAAALATGLSSLAAGYAVAAVGSAAVGAIAEKPELLGRLLIFVGLAEGIAIYGLIISILILNEIT